MTQAVETKFNFKQRRITEDGVEVGRTRKQPSLVVELPVPTAEELAEILQSQDEALSKQRTLVVEAVADLIRSQAKAQLDDVIDSFGADETRTVAVSDIDFDKLSLEYIANLEPAQRGARAISNEDWEAFYQDYMQVMVATTGKPEPRIRNHIELFKKPQKAKQNKDALKVLVEQLDIYMASSASLDDTGEAASRLRSKMSRWLNDEDKFDLSAL